MAHFSPEPPFLYGSHYSTPGGGGRPRLTAHCSAKGQLPGSLACRLACVATACCVPLHCATRPGTTPDIAAPPVPPPLPPLVSGFTMFWLVRAAPAHMLRLQASRGDDRACRARLGVPRTVPWKCYPALVQWPAAPLPVAQHAALPTHPPIRLAAASSTHCRAVALTRPTDCFAACARRGRA